MKTILLLLIALPPLLIAQEKEQKLPDPVTVSINATTLNIRAKNRTSSEVLCQVFRNDKLKVISLKGHWARIIAPTLATVWISTDSLKNQKIAHANTPVYAGPSRNFTIVQHLDTNAEIKILRTHNNWAMITPPAGLTAWVHTSFLLFPKHFQAPAAIQEETIEANHTQEKPSTPVIEEASTSTPQATPIIPVLKDKQKDQNHDIDIDKGYWVDHPLSSNHSTVHITGMVTKLKQEVKDTASHGLAVKVNDQYYPVAYLRSKLRKLKQWVGQKVIIKGKKEWISGWQRPVIIVQTIQLYTSTKAPELKQKQR